MNKDDFEKSYPDTADNDKRHSKQRRRVISGTAAGAGIALLSSGHWQKPVVESVILPVHADTSQNSSRFSLSDPCSVSVSESSGSNVVELTGVVLGPVGEVGNLNGTATLRVLNCAGQQSDTDSEPVITDSGGNYQAVFFSSVGACSPDLCAQFIVDVTFPGIGSATCSGIKSVCPQN